MAGERIFKLSTTPEDAHQEVCRVFESEGFTVTQYAADTVQGQRGKFWFTILFGAFAQKSFHISLFARITQVDGQTRVKLYRDTTKDLLKGGTLGAAKTEKQFKELVAALRAGFSAQGALVEVIAK